MFKPTEFCLLCWRYLTKWLIRHLSQSPLKPLIILVRLWNKPVLSNEGKASCSRKQRELFLLDSNSRLTTYETCYSHCATRSSNNSYLLEYCQFIKISQVDTLTTKYSVWHWWEESNFLARWVPSKWWCVCEHSCCNDDLKVRYCWTRFGLVLVLTIFVRPFAFKKTWESTFIQH